MKKVETNVLERLGAILGLLKDSEYKEAVDNFLDAASSEKEMEEAREILFNKLTEKISETEIDSAIREQENSELLYTTINNMRNFPYTDETFYNFAFLMENFTKSIVTKKLEETYTFDTKSITELAEKIDSKEALDDLKEYDENNKVESLLSALENISTTIKTAVFDLDKKDRKSRKMIKRLEKMDSALNEIRNTIYDENLAITGINIEKYASVSENAYNLVKKRSKKKETKGKNLFVKIGNALKKRKNYSLKRTHMAGKIVKGTIFGGVGILAVTAIVILYMKTAKLEEAYQPNNRVRTETTVDGKTLLEIVVPVSKLNDFAEIALQEAESLNETEITDNTKTEENNNVSTDSNKTVEATPAPTAAPAPTTAPTQAPTTAPTPAPTEAPIEKDPVIEDNIDANTLSLLTNAANTTFNNWSSFGGYDYETVFELTKRLNGYDSSISADEADGILQDMAMKAAIPGANNLLAGENLYSTNPIDFTSLLIKDQNGLSAVSAMQQYLNSALNDPSNLVIYAERALRDEAIIIEQNGETGGLSINSGDPAARLLWARLAIATNAITGTLGDDYSVDLNGTIYYQSSLSEAANYETIAAQAVQELQNQKTL